MTHVVHQSTSPFTRAALLGLLLAAALAPFTFAQTQPPALQLTLATVTHVKPGMMTDYREFMKSETLPAFKKAGGKQWATFINATFGKGDVIVTLRTVTAMKEFDETNFLVKALGEDGARLWVQKRARMIEGTETYLLLGLPELFIPRPTPNDPPKLGMLNVSQIAPGRTAEYESLMKNEVLPLLKKTGNKGFAMGRVLFGGDVNEYRSLSYTDSFEDVQKTGTALQAAGYGALTAKFAGIVLHSERLIVRFRPELSIRPEAQKAAQ